MGVNTYNSGSDDETGNEMGNSTIDDDENDVGEDDDDVIVIDSDDEWTIEVSQMRTKTQTFVLTFRKQTRYTGNEIINIETTIEKDYFEHYD